MKLTLLLVLTAGATLGPCVVAAAAPDDFQTTIAKAQRTLNAIDRTIDGIAARKGARRAVTSTARTGDQAVTRRRNATPNRTNRTRNNRPNRQNPNANKTKKP